MKKAKKTKTQDPQARLAPIQWNADDYRLTWLLLAEMEDGRKVLVGAEHGQVCYSTTSNCLLGC